MTKTLKTLAALGMTMGLALSAERSDAAEVRAWAEEPPRAPDYAEQTGKDWLFNHAIEGKECPDESAADNGIDMFYVYPTLTKEGIGAVDGFVLLDDPTIRFAGRPILRPRIRISTLARCCRTVIR